MSLLRLIDANANRAREGLRVMEDIARFTLDHKELSAKLKRARHDFAAAMSALPGGEAARLAQRDTQGDVGTTNTTAGEQARAGLRDIAAAAAKRTTEALRAIEETSKALPAPSPPGGGLGRGCGETDSDNLHPPVRPQPMGGGASPALFEAIRYRMYDIERDLLLALPMGQQQQWKLCVVLTQSLCTHHSWEDVARLSLEGGADCIQLREKTLDGRELLKRAKVLRELTNQHGASLVMNDRPDVALLAGADAVHVGQTDLSVKDVRAIAGDALLVGVSVTTMEQAVQALHNGADNCGVGPMFHTTTKAHPGGRTDGSLAGVDLLRAYVQHEPVLLPHLAIGGINQSNIDQLTDAGCKGVAVSSTVCSSAEPAQICETLVLSLQKASG